MSSFAARDYGPLNCPVIILNVRTAPALAKHLANISHKTLEYLGELLRGCGKCHRQQQQEYVYLILSIIGQVNNF